MLRIQKINRAGNCQFLGETGNRPAQRYNKPNNNLFYNKILKHLFSIN